ncbi:hypothetical protein Dsin_017945 [Dipteronia sinensis]|uniref:Uncharacterized protein n=1 Tax=Dipteronia sinensis TaxID=43782 RepID=A0AAE0AG93_9ROSI|nr:hypothetical protein Dsin_017945 [Dipteronia sinensis]
MGRSPCCSKVGLNRGAWTATEDKILTDYIKAHGDGKWRSLPKAAGQKLISLISYLFKIYIQVEIRTIFKVWINLYVFLKFAGLKRCGKSCRLRWLNYLRPDIKRGNLTPDEQDLIIRLHRLLGNRWSLIAGRLPGRTDNEVKNYWNTKLSKNKAQPKESKFDKKSITTSSPCNDHDGQASTKVFRTKAMRLMSHQVRQVMINNTQHQQQQQQQQQDPDQNHILDSNYNSTVESESTGGSSPSFSFQYREENSSEYVTGFDIEGISLSEFFDFDEFCDVNNVIKGDITGNPDDQSNTDLVLNEELMLENWNGGDGCDIQANMDSNFGTSASFLESGEDWVI